jgi:hypothetical protein
MQSGEKTLFALITESIDRDIERNVLNADEKPQKFKSFIIKDEQDCFCLVEDTTIKCVFEEKNMNDYLSRLPSYVNLEGKIY